MQRVTLSENSLTVTLTSYKDAEKQSSTFKVHVTDTKDQASVRFPPFDHQFIHLKDKPSIDCQSFGIELSSNCDRFLIGCSKRQYVMRSIVPTCIVHSNYLKLEIVHSQRYSKTSKVMRFEKKLVCPFGYPLGPYGCIYGSKNMVGWCLMLICSWFHRVST